MVQVIKEDMMREESKERESTLGQMGHFMRGNGWIIKLMGMASIFGLTAEFTRDSGEIIKCMGKDHISGQMEDPI